MPDRRRLLQSLKRPLPGGPEEPLDVTDEQAEQMVRRSIAGLSRFYPSDVACSLNLDYDQVCRVLAKMRREGTIRADS